MVPACTIYKKIPRTEQEQKSRRVQKALYGHKNAVGIWPKRWPDTISVRLLRVAVVLPAGP